jgi:hypothetical protein
VAGAGVFGIGEELSHLLGATDEALETFVEIFVSRPGVCLG